jgi:flavin reductase (DIM6/NTAB) family NADH-FMN oxidoreductase RutF
VKKAIKNFLFGSSELKEHAAVAIIPEQMRDRAYLGWEGANHLVDVTLWQWPLSLNPVIFGLALDAEAIAAGAHAAAGFSLSFVHESQLSNQNEPRLSRWANRPVAEPSAARLLLERFAELNAGPRHLLLLRATAASLFQLRFLRQAIITRYFHHYRFRHKRREFGLTHDLYRQCCAVYSFPRRVVLVIVRHQEYLNMFPMDFQGVVSESRHFVLGLRHSNRAVEMMRKAQKVVVCEMPADSRPWLYEMGQYHSITPPSIEALRIKTTASAQFGFPVPVIALGYREIRLARAFSLGSHMLLFGETEYELPAIDAPRLYHIHLLHKLLTERFGKPYSCA